MRVPWEMIPLVGILALAAVFVLGIVRAVSISRFGAADGRPVWTGAGAGMGVAIVGLVLLWSVTAGARVSPGVYFSGFALVNGAAIAFAGSRARAGPSAAAVAAGGVVAWLVLTFPLVDFVGSCLVGESLIVPSNC